MSMVTSNQQFFTVSSGTTMTSYPLDTNPAIPANRARVISTPIGSTFQSTHPSQKIEKIPYSEGMALYRQIKQRHDDLFRELADL
jgi:hypothetical protein